MGFDDVLLKQCARFCLKTEQSLSEKSSLLFLGWTLKKQKSLFKQTIYDISVSISLRQEADIFRLKVELIINSTRSTYDAKISGWVHFLSNIFTLLTLSH